MPPRDHQYYHHQHADSLEERAAIELEGMRLRSPKLQPMPPACGLLLRSLAGNDRCVDCGARHPEWATVSYGALICLECSGRHRSLGVQVRAAMRTLPNIMSLDEHLTPLLSFFTDFYCSLISYGSLVTRTSTVHV